MSNDNLWVEASRNVEAEIAERRLAMAKVALSSLWPFLAASGTDEEYALRKTLASDQIEETIASVVGDEPGAIASLREQVEASFDEDYEIHSETRIAAALTAAVAARQGARFRDPVTAAFDFTNATPEATCAEFKRLDQEFGTKDGPLSHDSRCPIHGSDPRHKVNATFGDDAWSDDNKSSICSTCNGTGRVMNGSGQTTNGYHPCPTCNGNGRVQTREAPKWGSPGDDGYVTWADSVAPNKTSSTSNYSGITMTYTNLPGQASRKTADDDGDKTGHPTAEQICPYCDFHGTNAEVAKHIADAGPDHQKDGTVGDQMNAKSNKTAAAYDKGARQGRSDAAAGIPRKDDLPERDENGDPSYRAGYLNAYNQWVYSNADPDDPRRLKSASKTAANDSLFKRLQDFDSAQGPWYPSDAPEDILLDIRSLDPYETKDITAKDIADYVAMYGDKGTPARGGTAYSSKTASDDAASWTDKNGNCNHKRTTGQFCDGCGERVVDGQTGRSIRPVASPPSEEKLQKMRDNSSPWGGSSLSSLRVVAGDTVMVSRKPMCDVHGGTHEADYDARLPGHGNSWGNVCQRAFDQYGPGQLGTGHGQRFVLSEAPDVTASKTADLDSITDEIILEAMQILAASFDPEEYARLFPNGIPKAPEPLSEEQAQWMAGYLEGAVAKPKTADVTDVVSPEPDDHIKAARDIALQGQPGPIDGLLIHPADANAIVQVHDSLSGENQTAYRAMPIQHKIDTAKQLLTSAPVQGARFRGPVEAGQKGHEFSGDYCKKCGMDKPEKGEWVPSCNVVSEGFGDPKKSSLQAEAVAWSWASGMGNRDNAKKPFKATHTYSPIGWDAHDARPHPGSSVISSGNEVMVHGKMDPTGNLLHISDEHGNHQTVDKRSLSPRHSQSTAAVNDYEYQCPACGYEMDDDGSHPEFEQAHACPECGETMVLDQRTLGARKTANPYAPGNNPFMTAGPGNPNSEFRGPKDRDGAGMSDGEPDGMDNTRPLTTRPRVMPSGDRSEIPVDPNHEEAPLDNDAKPVTPTRAAAALRDLLAPPTLTSRISAKVDQIVESLRVTDPTMPEHLAVLTAVDTIRDYPGMISVSHVTKDQPTPDMNQALHDYLSHWMENHGHAGVAAA